MCASSENRTVPLSKPSVLMCKMPLLPGYLMVRCKCLLDYWLFGIDAMLIQAPSYCGIRYPLHTWWSCILQSPIYLWWCEIIVKGVCSNECVLPMSGHPWLTTARLVLDMSCLSKLILQSLNGLGVHTKSVEQPALQFDLCESALWLLLFLHAITHHGVP